MPGHSFPSRTAEDVTLAYQAGQAWFDQYEERPAGELSECSLFFLCPFGSMLITILFKTKEQLMIRT